MVAHCWFTWVLYQCATETPDAFSPGEPLESGPNETKINAAATKPINHNQRFMLESFIAVPPFVPVRTSGSVTQRGAPGDARSHAPVSTVRLRRPKRKGR